MWWHVENAAGSPGVMPLEAFSISVSKHGQTGHSWHICRVDQPTDSLLFEFKCFF